MSASAQDMNTTGDRSDDSFEVRPATNPQRSCCSGNPTLTADARQKASDAACRKELDRVVGKYRCKSWACGLCWTQSNYVCGLRSLAISLQADNYAKLNKDSKRQLIYEALCVQENMEFLYRMHPLSDIKSNEIHKAIETIITRRNAIVAEDARVFRNTTMWM